MGLTSIRANFDPERAASIGDAAVENQAVDKVVALCRRFPVA